MFLFYAKKYKMKESTILLCLLLGFLKIDGQVSRNQIGFNLSNSIFIATAEANENFKTHEFLSLSAGVLVRHNFHKKKKKRKGRRNYFNTANHDGLSLNFGISYVHTGYEYQFKNIKTFTNYSIIEFPILLTAKFTNDFWMSKKLIKKGYGSYGNFGVKPSITPTSLKVKEIRTQEIRLTETYNSTNLNFTPTIEFGIDREHENGNYTSVGISTNIGLKRRSNVTLDYENISNQVTQRKSFSFTEIYFAINIIHLINISKLKIGKGTPPPIIHNPRYN